MLEQLLKFVDWDEALARACAELLEGEWAARRNYDHLSAYFVPQLNLAGGTKALASALQWLLDDYASYLLSNQWGVLSEDNFFVDEHLLDRAKVDFKPRSQMLTCLEGVSDKSGGQVLYEASFRLACRLKRLLLPLKDLRFDQLQFQVLPPPDPIYYKGVRALLALPKDDGAWPEERGCLGACFVIQAGGDGQRTPSRVLRR